MDYTRGHFRFEDGGILGTWEDGIEFQIANISPTRWSPSKQGDINNARLAKETPHNGSRIVACLNAMARVTIPDGQEPDGAVAALVDVAEKTLEFCAAFPLHENDRVTDWTRMQVEGLYEILDAALARFKVAGDGEEGS